MLSILPGLLLYVVAVLLSPDLSVVEATWDLPIRVIAASCVMILPTASVALCLSSMTTETRYASFAWFAFWVLGWSIYALMAGAESFAADQGFVAADSAWALVSPYHVLSRVQNWIFGFTTFASVRSEVWILIIVTVVMNAIMLRRISAPMRA